MIFNKKIKDDISGFNPIPPGDYVAALSGSSKEYRTGDTVITALQPSTVQFRKHELTLIIGPSGSGKTTLLSLLGCVIYPTAGDVWVNGHLVNALNSNELANSAQQYRFVFQNFNLLAPLTALENVMQPLLLMKYLRKLQNNGSRSSRQGEYG
jgi:putative ABC transport system ATP-binding protein